MLVFTTGRHPSMLDVEEVVCLRIRENIAATLKRKMGGKTLISYAEELGIPKSSLQEYLQERLNPRADTIELLARALGLTPAELVSGTRFDSPAHCTWVDAAEAEIAQLHPLVQPLAAQQLYALQAAFALSGILKGREVAPAYHYVLDEPVDHSACQRYGLAIQEPDGGTRSTGAFSSDRAAVERLAEICTRLQLSPVHLLDVMEDFLKQKKG